MFSIGELSHQTGISAQAIRYYERIELIPSAQRAKNGYRIYQNTDVERLRFIQRVRQLDFSLDNIAEILALRERGEAPCYYVTDVMKGQIREIQNRLQDLQRLQDELLVLYQTSQELPIDTATNDCVCNRISDWDVCLE
jgi:MerR family transcriptional regulator, copper efflux regulator